MRIMSDDEIEDFYIRSLKQNAANSEVGETKRSSFRHY